MSARLARRSRYSAGVALKPCISSSGGDAIHLCALTARHFRKAGMPAQTKVTKALPLLFLGLRQGSDFLHSGIAPWAAAIGDPWPPVRLTRHPCRVTHCAIPALGRPQVAICVAHKFCADLQNQKQRVSQEEVMVKNPRRRFALAFAFPASISQTTQNARREGERRCRGGGRSAWMPSERRWAMDGPSARAHPTAPERTYPREAGAGRQRRGFGYFWHQK